MNNCLKIFYHGHSCFEVKTGSNSILFDPHPGESIGLKPIETKADIVLITHEHFDHNAKENVVKENTQVLSSYFGEKRLNANAEEIFVKGFKLPHDNQGGRKRGFVAAYLVKIRNFKLLHLGDLGSDISNELLNEVKKERIDFLFIPVGGYYTIGPQEAWEISKKINPEYIVPMHYWRKNMNLPISPLSDFLKFVNVKRTETTNPFEYCKDIEKIEREMEVLLFKEYY
ncbi:MBL fold metallo-hydrolase [Fervidicoccus fontis]|uniref:Zn-dependent hydrolase of the metallo-beta-lactamase superfamily protein n=1 Tax=Fervidicoccus fontis (strain DSM 19380 / JCM 18336 / VKM B-2539 / Kam940) TaxID=1163730 RepID=H9ZZU5_FERFK|nr:MBL fold metallo-hydrolase [Fervidicoccus fontis]AFH42252.1 Zn-dependent hydrolase of the metallo-beta-lactamase superfamily protein [Fervidicoccus fontis Kam940]